MPLLLNNSYCILDLRFENLPPALQGKSIFVFDFFQRLKIGSEIISFYTGCCAVLLFGNMAMHNEFPIFAYLFGPFTVFFHMVDIGKKSKPGIIYRFHYFGSFC